ncbi:flagellar filament capping protein FliD [Anaerocolumna sp. AGMB13025]|uniref:flagellar filament capping protein FliD n=1 Tax=Anaerocolumna sp. AGMB13025 TaxID=3039116 RepID=UPI00241C44D1|nr:flagellar filament capping protein FliD [Anaerocolumna sp. AGMB13025]WFR56804.1 flagellar filament capping protein FliD [Anaerocolumna sp. AGMB13025]
MSTIRMTGLISGLDTESIIKELVSAQKLKNKKTSDKLTLSEWKEDKWKELNIKLTKLYKEQLSDMRLQGSYMTKKVTSSNENIATVTAGKDAPTGAQTLKILETAGAQYVTGGVIELNGAKATEKTTLNALGIDAGTVFSFKSGSSAAKTLEVKSTTTIADFVNAAKSAGLNASYDAGQGRLFISSKESGTANSFQISSYTSSAVNMKNNILDKVGYSSLAANDKAKVDGALATLLSDASVPSDIDTAKNILTGFAPDDQDAAVSALADNYKAEFQNPVLTDDFTKLNKLGLDALKSDGSKVDGASTLSTLIAAKNSKIELNGVELEYSTNDITVNGLTLNIKDKTAAGQSISLNITDNTQATYDMVKNFIKSYNDILDQMNKLYYANSAKGYAPLTDDQREAMTDDQIEKWETKIKDSSLRRDSSLGFLIDSMKSALMSSVTVNGKRYSLDTFGIQTSSDYTEKGLLHIYGDKDDSTYSDQKDKLMKALTDDPDTVMKAISGISQKLYDAMGDKMKAIPNVRSIYTFYDDKLMDKEQDSYKKQVATLEAKLTQMENKYYKQFSAMETAMAKLQSQSNSLAGLLNSGK